MKRDLETVRRILLDVEESEETLIFNEPSKAYQIAAMSDVGLVEAFVQGDEMGSPIYAVVNRLTWQGHDFLDASRDDNIWNKAKEKFLKPGVSWTFSIVSEYLKQEILHKLGMQS